MIVDPKPAIACVRPRAVVSGYERQKGNGSLAGAETMSLRAFTRRCGAYLALAALMLQLALSFEHVHKHDVAFSGLGRSDVRAQSQQRFGVELVLMASHSRQELEAFGKSGSWA